MNESLLTVLKFLLLILLYLFFFRVLRAVWAEVSAPARSATTTTGTPAATAPGAPTVSTTRPGGRATAPSKGTPNRLKVLEPADRKGHAFDLADELTVGRAAGCQVRVDDGFASQLHARLYRSDGQLYVEDLGSTNGTYVSRKGTSNKEKVTGPAVLRIGDRLVVGRTVLEVCK